MSLIWPSQRISRALAHEGDVKLTGPKYAPLLESWRRVVWYLLTEPGDGQARTHSVCSKLNSSLRSLVPFMIASGQPDLSHIDRDCKVLFVGDHEALRRAIVSEPSSSQRRSPLAWHLAGAVKPLHTTTQLQET